MVHEAKEVECLLFILTEASIAYDKVNYTDDKIEGRENVDTVVEDTCIDGRECFRSIIDSRDENTANVSSGATLQEHCDARYRPGGLAAQNHGSVWRWLNGHYVIDT